MKAIKFKFILLLLLVPLMVTASNKEKYKYTKEKKISREFTVNSNAALGVLNKYGNVYVTTWNENKTVIDVAITVSGNKEDNVTKRINGIDVNFTADKSNVKATTVIGNTSGNNISIEINYTIKIPRQGSIDISNQYGSILLGKINGESKLNCKYGEIKAEELNNSHNNIAIEYSGPSKIIYLKKGKVVAKYSDLSIGNTEELMLESQYTDVKLNKAGQLNFKASYGDIYIVNGGRIIGENKYADTKIGTVTEILNITSEYGDVIINSIQPGVANISVNTIYSDVKMTYPTSYSFDFEFNLSYGDLNGKSGLTLQQSTEKSFSAYYKGFNKNSGSSKVYIKTSYGDISLKKL